MSSNIQQFWAKEIFIFLFLNYFLFLSFLLSTNWPSPDDCRNGSLIVRSPDLFLTLLCAGLVVTWPVWSLRQTERWQQGHLTLSRLGGGPDSGVINQQSWGDRRCSSQWYAVNFPSFSFMYYLSKNQTYNDQSCSLIRLRDYLCHLESPGCCQ